MAGSIRLPDRNINTKEQRRRRPRLLLLLLHRQPAVPDHTSTGQPKHGRRRGLERQRDEQGGQGGPLLDGFILRNGVRLVPQIAIAARCAGDAHAADHVCPRLPRPQSDPLPVPLATRVHCGWGGGGAGVANVRRGNAVALVPMLLRVVRGVVLSQCEVLVAGAAASGGEATAIHRGGLCCGCGCG